MKDNFSKLSQQYAQFRPQYPAEVFEYITSLVTHHETAWDCATGNGQVARGLAKNFKQVMATDISEQQISHAHRADNIQYTIAPAEHTSFPDNTFDLITVGQAIHWFDFSAFYAEARRTAKNNSLLVILGYDLIRVDDAVNKIIHHYYEEVLRGFWDPERKYVDERYQTIPFPFKEIYPPQFQLRLDWTAEQFLGYLGTWSAAQHYLDHNHGHPVDQIRDELLQVWKEEEIKTVVFPILLRPGIIEKDKN